MPSGDQAAGRCSRMLLALPCVRVGVTARRSIAPRERLARVVAGVRHHAAPSCPSPRIVVRTAARVDAGSVGHARMTSAKSGSIGAFSRAIAAPAAALTCAESCKPLSCNGLRESVRVLSSPLCLLPLSHKSLIQGQLRFWLFSELPPIVTKFLQEREHTMGGIAYCRGCLPPSDTHRILAKVLQFCWRPRRVPSMHCASL